MTSDAPTMRSRPAAQSVIEKLLSLYEARPAQSGIERLFGVPLLRAEETSWYVGARGEIAVASLLAKLPGEWTVLHSLPVGKSDTDIDHLLVGPAGVFTINTKHHSGKPIWVAGSTFMVSGQKQNYIRSAESEAARVSMLIAARMSLGTPVRSIIALVEPKQISIKEKPKHVTVIDARHLVKWLTKRPVVLGADEIAILVELLESPDVWRKTDPFSVDARDRFAELHSGIRSAALRRGLWAAAGIVLIVAALAVLTHLPGI
jgi:hypothetical protein